MGSDTFSTTTLPLLFVFTSFVVTFLVTRLVTRLIRAGKGPFKDNVSEDGVHVHHAVYGIFALLAGAVINTGAASSMLSHHRRDPHRRGRFSDPRRVRVHPAPARRVLGA